jgi:serine protease
LTALAHFFFGRRIFNVQGEAVSRFITAVVAVGVTVAWLAAAAAVPAFGRAPGGPGRGLEVMNLHGAYEAHLGHIKHGKIAGITYAKGKQPSASAAKASCAEPDCPLVYGGGPVQHKPHLYLLLWGPAWSSDSGEQASASYLESFYAGLGTQPDDSWSTITDQYSDSSGAPSFSGSVYEGAFQDTSTPPNGVDQSQLAAEADAFASSHGITDLSDAQIIVATQSGTCPAGFFAKSCANGSGDYCAWHSASNEPYTNLPYLLDAGTSCGEGFVNKGATSGTDDGFSIVGGHEYAETITDPVPNSGWVDTSDPYGGEIGDKCAWGGGGWGGHDPSGNVTLSTGTFAMQSLWSNAASEATGAGCVMSTSTALSSSANPAAQGQLVTYTATVSPVPDGGTVAFADGAGTISGCGSVGVSTTTGQASCQATYTAGAGSPHAIRASYSGDPSYIASVSSTLSETVNRIGTSTALSSSANPAALGQQVTYTATVSPVPNGGTVAFADGAGTISGCGSVGVSTTTGQASCQASYTTAASSPHAIEASYSGDPDYKQSQSSALAQSVLAPSVQTGSATSSAGGGGGQSVTVPGSLGSTGSAGGGGAQNVNLSGLPRSTGGSVRDTVDCSAPAGQSCRVTETLTTTETLSGGKPIAVSSLPVNKRNKNRKTVVVGARTVTIAADGSATITIKLNDAGRKLLKRFGKLPVVVSIVLNRNGQQVTVARRKITIKPPKKLHQSRDPLVPGPLSWIRF